MKTISTLIAITMVFNLFSQTKVYDSIGKKRSYTKEDVDLEFSKSTIKIPKKSKEEAFAAIAAAVPTLIDLGFKIATNVLESRVKKFSGEYQVQKSYLEPESREIPNLIFTRKVTIGKHKDTVALKLTFKPKLVADSTGFVYYIDSTELGYSKARWKKRHNGLDYTIQIIPTFLVDKEMKSQELAPISLTGIGFGKHPLSESKNDSLKYRTTFIPIPKDALFLNAGIKIIEVNPAKIKAEKILEIYNKYKDDAITIINKILPKEEKEEKAPATGKSSDPNQPQGN
ncbi:hypothetical protein [Fluviicola taffensis]|uniref:hypothetical protein n=1 Tax=Fluviicola taffensis TaxID=191579 RepID=UPI003137F18E